MDLKFIILLASCISVMSDIFYCLHCKKTHAKRFRKCLTCKDKSCSLCKIPVIKSQKGVCKSAYYGSGEALDLTAPKTAQEGSYQCFIPTVKK